MAVPARPVEGAPVDVAWGGVAHDTAVAMDIQAGVVSVVVTNQIANCAIITFPRPFAAVPTVVVTQDAGASGWFSYTAGNTTTTGLSACLAIRTGTASSITAPVRWIAYGPRA